MSVPGSSDRNLDWITFSLYICLVVVGWLMIYTVGYGDGYTGGTGAFFKRQIGKQTIWIGVSLVIMFLVFVIDWKFWQTFSTIIYAFAMFLLVAVVFFGVKIKGATSCLSTLRICQISNQFSLKWLPKFLWNYAKRSTTSIDSYRLNALANAAHFIATRCRFCLSIYLFHHHALSSRHVFLLLFNWWLYHSNSYFILNVSCYTCFVRDALSFLNYFCF